MGSTCFKVLFILVLFIVVCTKASMPFIKSTEPGRYRVLPEDYNGTVCRINVVDSDIGDTIKISPGDDVTAKYFNIVPDLGTGDFWINVTIKELLDRETLTEGNVKLTLWITDSIHNQNKNFEYTVYISDINDNRPEFFNFPYQLEIDEKPCKNGTEVYGTEVYTQIKASDKDTGNNGRVRYSMDPMAQSQEAKQLYSDTFSIDSQSGKITLKRCLDYESNNYYQFIVFAKDSGTPQMSSTAGFIILVKDVQDMPPFFTGDPYRITIKEDKNIGSEVITVNAKDGDLGVSNKVNYSITNGSCPGFFKINPTNGTILISKELDRDASPINTTGKCVLTIETQEIENWIVKNYNSTTATATVTITVDDTDDNEPEFGNHMYYATVAENTPEDVPIKLNTTIVVTDIDQGDNANMIISLKNTDNTTCRNFFASPSEIQGRGRVMILVKNGSILDYEKLRNTTIQVLATGKGNPNFYDMATVHIAIQDKNDNIPKFNQTTFDLTVHENAENGTVVNTITATDADISPEFKIKTYSISGGSDPFDVNSSGVITTKCNNCSDELDREKQADYYMILFAEDGSGSRSSVVLHVTLTDENDNSPKFSRPVYTSFVEENMMTNIIKLEASDRDQQNNPNSEFSFSLVNSTEPGKFAIQNLTINNTTGDISLAKPIDYEHLKNTKGEVNITVKVTDNGSKPLSTTAIVQLAVQICLISDSQIITMIILKDKETVSSFKDDILRKLSEILGYSAIFDSLQDHFDMFENGALNIRSSKLKFYLVEKDSQAFLSGEKAIQLIDTHANNGEMQQLQSTYNVMRVSQLKYDYTFYNEDVNHKSPMFQNLSSYTLEINELPCKKTVVYTNIHATDKNLGANSVVRYAMTPKVQSSAAYTMYSQTFSIDPLTGHVSLNSCLDFERNSYYQFTVTAQHTRSNIRLTSTTELVILVKDVIDESAFITG